MIKARFAILEKTNPKWERLLRAMKKLAENKSYVKVGIIQEGKAGEEHKDESTGNSDGLSLGELAIMHEVGGKHLSPRPWISGGFEASRDKNIALFTKLLTKVVFEDGEQAGETDIERVLGLMGTALVSDIQKYVTTSNNLAPNADSTIAAKGSSRPLVNTMQMLRALTWAVVMDGNAVDVGEGDATPAPNAARGARAALLSKVQRNTPKELKEFSRKLTRADKDARKLADRVQKNAMRARAGLSKFANRAEKGADKLMTRASKAAKSGAKRGARTLGRTLRAAKSGAKRGARTLGRAVKRAAKGKR